MLSPEQRQQWAALAWTLKGLPRASQLKGTSPHTQEHRLNQVLKGLPEMHWKHQAKKEKIQK